MEWDEFTNYIINNYNNGNTTNLIYSLRSYSISKNNIDSSDFTESISTAFYIEKFNLIGLVQDSKSVIQFYDGTTCKKLKAQIDIKETQKEINELEIIELNNRAVELVKKEDEEKKLKMKLHQEYVTKMKMNLNKNSNSNSQILNNSSSMKQSSISPKRIKKETNEKTPEKLKHELAKINNDKLDSINKSINKKLTVLTTEFIPEYDTLLVSSSNNKISAWKYIEGEFKNVNKIKKNVIDKNNFSCAILNTDSPQNTMTWDPMQKHLYTGQTDGKILKWDLTKSKNLEGEIFDFSIAKNKHERELKYGKEKISMETKTIISSTHQNNQSSRNQKKINEENLRGEKLLSIMKKENMNRESVSCILILGKLQLLAAGYYNGNVILWDTMLKDYRKYYTDQDTCIYQIVYDSNKNLLFTCGFDHDIFIYDPYIDCNAIYKLVGHNWSINSIAINSSDEELVSIDILGNIKLWDINTFFNFQTINLNESIVDKKLQQDINNSKKKKYLLI
jgi:WD40 repeat protein